MRNKKFECDFYFLIDVLKSLHTYDTEKRRSLQFHTKYKHRPKKGKENQMKKKKRSITYMRSIKKGKKINANYITVFFFVKEKII